MTDGVIGAIVGNLRRNLISPVGMVALVGALALITGTLLSTAAVRIICGLIVAAAALYIYVYWRNRRQRMQRGDKPSGGAEEAGQDMKTLVFDDYQAAGGPYIIKELENEKGVVPSSKSAYPAPVALAPETVRELEILDFFDLDSDETYDESEPKSEFHSLVNKVLLVLKDVLFAHTVAFFWANREKRQLVLESMATDSSRFVEGRRFSFDQDLASQVAGDGKAQVVGQITPHAEPELLRYYDAPDGIRSALAVPVFFKERANEILPVGVIVADSKAEDAFGQETLVLMGRFTKLVSALLKSYTDKYDLLLDSELLASLRRLQDRVKSDSGEEAILAALADETNRLAGWDTLAIVMYDEGKHGWVVQKVVNKTGAQDILQGQPVEMSGSTVGEAVRTNGVKMIEDLGAGDHVRYHHEELRATQGSFLSVPISSFNRCYGAVTLESRTGSRFSGHEVETIYRLVENAAAALEVLYVNNLAKEYVVVDPVTGCLTKRSFVRRVEEEVRRAEDFGTELSCISVSVDGIQEHASRYGKEGVEAILVALARILRGGLRLYDALGRQEDDRFGVLLVNTAASDGYLWAEKIRKAVASHVVHADGKSFSVTISAGVCGLSEGMHATELMAGTAQVLGKAVEKGGNLVRVY